MTNREYIEALSRLPLDVQVVRPSTEGRPVSADAPTLDVVGKSEYTGREIWATNWTVHESRRGVRSVVVI